MMKPVHIVFFILIFLLFEGSSCNAFAQPGNFAAGFTLKNNGKMLRGELKDRSQPPFDKKFKKVRFRTKGITVRKFGPGKISRYCIADDCYESIRIDRQRSYIRETFNSERGKGEKVFVKVVVDGYLSLYYFEFNDPESHTIDFIPLFKRKNETELVRVTQGIFGLKKQLLSRYFADSPELVANIMNGTLKTPIEIAEYYNRVKGY